MNPWFDRVRAALTEELSGIDGLEEAATLTADQADALLRLAGDAAHTSGVRQYAPLATFLAGRIVQLAAKSNQAERAKLIEAVAKAVRAAGPAGE